MDELRSTALGFFTVVIVSTLLAHAASAAGADPHWQLADRSGKGDAALALFVEQIPTPGRPTFRLETTFDVPPSLAHQILSESMLNPNEAPSGQRRKVLERTSSGTIVYTFIDLPMMLSDRELAIRVVESSDPGTGIHRVEWSEANDLLPPAKPDVVRVTGAAGFWEFRPNGHGGTQAIHETRTELGSSIPQSIGDRLMKSQAIDSVEALRERIAKHTQSDVAAGPP